MLMDTIPRIKLACLPTPLQEAYNLSVSLGGPRIFIKRDDLTGLMLGGNKARKLEFMLADAKSKGADVIITTGSSQSNHASQTAAAARKLNMEPILVLRKGAHPETQGNLFLDSLLDAQVQIIDDDIHGSLCLKRMNEIETEVRHKGHNPYLIPTGASTPLGSVGYVNAVAEICDQLKEQGVAAQNLICAVGSCGTIAGLIVGAKHFQAPFQVVGISVKDMKKELISKITRLANETAKLLEMDLTFVPSEIMIYDEYIGEGYGIPTPQGIEVTRLMAQIEGIILDPVYTSKAMSGLIDLIRQGRFTAKDIVIFVHTGGTPSVFAYTNELLAQTS